MHCQIIFFESVPVVLSPGHVSEPRELQSSQPSEPASFQTPKVIIAAFICVSWIANVVAHSSCLFAHYSPFLGAFPVWEENHMPGFQRFQRHEINLIVCEGFSVPCKTIPSLKTGPSRQDCFSCGERLRQSRCEVASHLFSHCVVCQGALTPEPAYKRRLKKSFNSH